MPISDSGTLPNRSPSVSSTSFPRSPRSEIDRPPTRPKTYTGCRGGLSSAADSSLSAIRASSVARKASSAPKKRSAGTHPEMPWCGRKWL